MKRAFLTLTALAAFLSARAEIEILYLAPNDDSPVLGSISTNSKAYDSATPVDGKEGWMEIVREDYYSGFIAEDSLTPDGEVEIGTSMLLTPSRTGKVLTTIEAGDEVSINLVDDWTEITVYKEIPGYFVPATSKPTPPSVSASGNRQVTYARDPLLAQASQTRYTPATEASTVGSSTSSPVAAMPTIPTSEPMTGFEEVDSLNPTFGRTSASGDTEGYSLGAGSTPIPRRDTTAPFLETSMEAPTSIAAIPAPTPTDPDPAIEAPTQAEEVDQLSQEDSFDIEETGEVAEPPADALAAEDAAAEMQADEVSSDESMETQEEAAESLDDSEVIPLAPVAAGATAAAASGGAQSPAPAATAEPVEPTPAVIVEVEEDVEVSNEVAEAVIPGITQPSLEKEPPLIPPTDTNRIYVGKLQRTKKGFWGSKPEHDFELMSYYGDRIAYVDLSEVPMGSYDKFTEQIVQVYGVLVPTEENKTTLIKAANITLR